MGKEPPLLSHSQSCRLMDVPAPQQRPQGLAEGGPSAAHPSWSEAGSQMFPASGGPGWGQGRPAVGQRTVTQMLSLCLLLISWPQVTLVLLLTFGWWLCLPEP